MRTDPGRREGGGPARRALPRVFAALLATLILVPAARAAFPVEIKDDRGITVRLSSEPRRLVSLAPSLTEYVFLLGQEGKLVGVTRYCNYPPRANSLPRIGGISDPDIERVVAAAPDLVLCTTDGNPKEKVRAIEHLGIPCFCTGPQDLAAIFAAVERIGDLLGVPTRAREEAASLKGRAARARRTAAPGSAPRVLVALSTSPLIAAGKGTFLDELVRLAGGRNAAASFAGRYPRLSVEDTVKASPDIVFVAAMAGVERLPPEMLRWKEVPAFRDGGIITLDGDLVTRPGPRMVAALEEIAKALSAWRGRRDAGTATQKGPPR